MQNGLFGSKMTQNTVNAATGMKLTNTKLKGSRRKRPHLQCVRMVIQMSTIGKSRLAGWLSGKGTC